MIQALSDLLQLFTLELMYILLGKANTPPFSPPTLKAYKGHVLACEGDLNVCVIDLNIKYECWTGKNRRGRVCWLAEYQIKVLLEGGRIGLICGRRLGRPQ